MIDKAAVIGTGVIGSAWIALFLAKGIAVVAVDPDPTAARRLRTTVARMTDALKASGLIPATALIDTDQVQFAASPGPELAGVGLVQENIPERIELKRATFAAIEAFVGPDTILASSTTALKVSDIQSACRKPGRVIAAHPINPPHLMPLVEISGGDLTESAILDRAMEFYTFIGKKPVRLAREIEGHIAGRLSAALWREAVYLVEQGIATVADIDAAVVNGPGLRWATMGPHMTYHVGGGAGGIEYYLEHLGDSQVRRWDTLGNPALTSALKARISDGVLDEAGTRSVEVIAAERDRKLAEAMRAFAC